MQETNDTPDLPYLIKDRQIANVKHQLRASSIQNIPHEPAIDMAQFQEKIMNIELKNCIYEHTDSGPDGLVERTFPDSVVPFGLKGLLDAKILQFPKLVEELVDRISTFYMITDPSIGCRDQSPPPPRRWTAAAAGKPLAASSSYNLRRKPDVALVNVIGDEIMSLTGPDGWSKVNALCETSITNLSGNMTIEGTLQQKSYIMFMEQDDQLFNPTIFFSGNSFGFHLFDRTGLHCFVAPLTASTSPERILCILGCLFFGRPAMIGYDETIRSDGGRAKEIYHDEIWWTVDRELHKSESFVGRSTKCWVVSRGDRDGGRKTLVLKDPWANTSHAETEPNILKRIRDENINQGRSLPRFHSWSRVGVPISNNEVDSTRRPLMTTDSTSRRSPSDHPNQSPCDHCHLLFGPVAYPLTCFINLKDLVGIFFDVVQGIFSHLSPYEYF
jgi:hypothetical protein